jgi:glycosyltransferase involved in cell wall biosynthesis
MKLSVVIPAYNESVNIPIVIAELQKNILSSKFITSHEVIVVDDHSADGTFDAVKGMNDPQVKCLRLSKRSGSHTAIRAGLRYASGDVTMCISADGQDDPIILDQMIEKVKNGAHTVWGIRNARNETFSDKFAALMFYATLRIFASSQTNQIDLSNADFYLLSKRSRQAINQCEERNTSLFGLIIWLGFKQDYVNYDRRERLNGKSKWSLKSRARLAIDWILAFSGIPLRLITYAGLIVSFIAVCYAMFILWAALNNKTTPGWASTALMVLMGSALLMIMMGVIGEYLWRNFDETRKRPLFFIEDETTE